MKNYMRGLKVYYEREGKKLKKTEGEAKGMLEYKPTKVFLVE